MPDILLSASILSADFACLGEQIHSAEAAGVDWIHVDVMDGQFVPNISMGPFIVEHVKRLTSLPVDVHLMIQQPERYITSFANAGATGLSIHIENNSNVYRTLQEIRAVGCQPGIVINPGTPAQAIVSTIPLVDLVLVMTVNPGYSGQGFIPETMGKVAEVRSLLADRDSSAVIQVDGGITSVTLPAAYEAGARCFVAATSIFKYPQGIAQGIAALRQCVA